jgi:hypothetical protein
VSPPFLLLASRLPAAVQPDQAGLDHRQQHHDDHRDSTLAHVIHEPCVERSHEGEGHHQPDGDDVTLAGRRNGVPVHGQQRNEAADDPEGQKPQHDENRLDPSALMHHQPPRRNRWGRRPNSTYVLITSPDPPKGQSGYSLGVKIASGSSDTVTPILYNNMYSGAI